MPNTRDSLPFPIIGVLIGAVILTGTFVAQLGRRLCALGGHR